MGGGEIRAAGIPFKGAADAVDDADLFAATRIVAPW